MTLPEVLKAAQDNLAAIAASVTALGVIIAAVIKARSYLRRSRLLVPNAFPWPEIPGDQVIFADAEPDETMLFGRKKEVRKVVRAIHESSLTPIILFNLAPRILELVRLPMTIWRIDDLPYG